ncbi:MAG: MFS transporter [Nitrospirae bacterium]|nr:MFS transporter [Nitrospirota bacterium]MCL5421660.1 MFS transporter [Nitrospirota bacterium]
MMKTHRPHDRFPALYVRDFRIFWIGQLISFSGTWMQSTAQGWLVYSLTKSPFYLGLVATVASLPVLFFTLIGGVVADRLMKRKLLVITQTLSMIPALALAVLIDLKMVTVWQIIVFATLLGTVNAFDVPARQSFLIEMVQKGRLLNAIALNSAAFNGARIIGPFIAGITIASIGVAACFYVNTVSFLAAIIALLMIKTRSGEGKGLSARPSPESRTEGGLSVLLQDLKEGLSFVKGERNVFRILLLVAIFSLLGIPFVTLLPVFAEDILKVGPRGLGVLAGSSGVGALTAALLIAFKGEIERKGQLMVWAGVTFGAALLFFSLSRDYLASTIILVFAGWGVVSFLAVANSFIQLRTPDVLRGRVMSVYALVFLGIAPIGNAVMGSVAHMVGTGRAISIGASLCLLAVLLCSKYMRSMDKEASYPS